MSPLHTGTDFTREELQLAARNHGLPLEALRYPITPVGLHYILVHYDIPRIDPAAWRLEVRGLVEKPLDLGLDALRALPGVTLPVTFECAGNGRARLAPRPLSQPWLSEAVGTAEWTGVSLRTVLEQAGCLAGAVEVVFTGCDRGIENGTEQAFERSLSITDAMTGGAILAHGMNGGPLPPQHGFPLRLVVPGWYGMTNVKWLRRITVTAEPFGGYQQVWAYRIRQEENDPGEPLTLMAPRSLLAPPGIPDFFTRLRMCPRGSQRVEGRAWSGRAPIERVDFSDDGGSSWRPAELERPLGLHAWRGWWIDWEPRRSGAHVLASRARDAAGNEQPLSPPWNLGGYANNAVERVEVTVA